MTTHKNTLEKQYRHALLNGLTTGTIVGAVWATVFLILYVNSWKVIDLKEYPSILIMSLTFPLVGWLTGLWERRVYACDDPKKRRCRAKIIGAAMATLAGVLMFFLSSPLGMVYTLSGKEIAAHVVLLMVFPFAGLVLSIIGIRLKNSSASFIPSMSVVTVIIILWLRCFGSTCTYFCQCFSLNFDGYIYVGTSPYQWQWSGR